MNREEKQKLKAEKKQQKAKEKQARKEVRSVYKETKGNKELHKLQNGYTRKKNTKNTSKLHIQIVNT